ncbi:MAG: LPS export ABC transporter periplasmic protein LptC [Hyphomicrobiaceae bacterium]
MANLAILTDDDQARARDDRVAGHGIVLAGDRTREFRRARTHSVLVRLLRWGCPLSAVGMAALYVSTMLETAGYGKPAIPPSITPTLSKDFAMDNPRYEGFTKDGGKYVVTAKTALPDFNNPTQIQLNGIVGEMFDARKSRTDFTAGRGLYDTKADQLDLTEGISVVTQSGMNVQLQIATMHTKAGTLTSDAPVKVEMPTGVITANRLNLNQKTRDIAFADSVVAHLLPPAKPEAVGGTAAPVAKGKELAAFGNANAPVDVTADRLDVHDNAKSAQFSGNVRAVQGAAQIETNVLEIAYESGKAKVESGAEPAGDGAVAPVAADPAAAAKIKRIVAPGPVVMTQGTGDRVTGNSAEFDAAALSATVTGSVVMTSGVDKRATAEKAEFQSKTDGIELSGNVVVNSGRNELRGRRLSVNRKAGTTLLTAAAENGLPKSRIFARLYQGDGQPAKAAPKKSEVAEAAAAAGAAAGMGFATFKTDPNSPVDIEADKLAVDDGKKQAVFSGDVKAAQGDFVIRTGELHAVYSGEAGLASVSAPAGDKPKVPAQLTKIEAKGKVIVASKQNQQVTGDWATFDMKANTVVVGGKEVILTQDKNIVTCNKLLIDMTSGLSRCITESVAGKGETAGPGKRGRASVIFYPQERQKGTIAPVKPAAPVNPASSSWESAVEPNKN